MTIEAKIICDSVGPNGVRLTTYVLKYPRFIHSEFMTHRMFSRNASSSRAIPFEKQVEMIIADPAMPLEFRQNKKGMQAGEAIQDQDRCKRIWLNTMQDSIARAHALADLGVHKQYVNRLLEPFAHISVVCTATDYSNFFALRHHSMAQPEIAELAKQMWEAYKTNTSKQLKAGEWHLPFVTEEEKLEHEELLKTATDPLGIMEEIDWYRPLIIASVARCARVSYLTHEGKKPDREADLALYNRLLSNQPIHASPAEHQATPRAGEWSGNFFGWIQYRKTLENENITEFKEPLG